MRRKTLSFILVVSLLLSMSSATFAQEVAAPVERYIDIEIPLVEQDMVQSDGTVARMASASIPLLGNAGMIRLYLAPGQTEAYSGAIVFDMRDDSIPISARVTNVAVTSTRSAVPGVTYYIAVGKAGTQLDFWSPDYLWQPVINIPFFNGEDPWGLWCIDIYAVRDIPNPEIDFETIPNFV